MGLPAAPLPEDGTSLLPFQTLDQCLDFTADVTNPRSQNHRSQDSKSGHKARASSGRGNRCRCEPELRPVVVVARSDSQNNLRIEWQESTKSKDDVSKLPVCLYWHGGGYVVGSKEGSRPNTTILAQNGVRVLSINYRMGPEVNHPAALTDAYSTYKWALSQGVKASQMVFSGDSA